VVGKQSVIQDKFVKNTLNHKRKINFLAI